MLGRLFRMGAYAKSPKTAFTMFHPMRAAKIGAGIWLARKLLGRFSGKSKRKPRRHTTA
jgi:hypothetical protein